MQTEHIGLEMVVNDTNTRLLVALCAEYSVMPYVPSQLNSEPVTVSI